MNPQARLKATIIAVLLVCTLSACATLTHGSHTAFVVRTTPAGARVITDLPRSGKDGQPQYYGCEATPCSMDIPRRSDFNVMIIRKGFQAASFVITKDRLREAAVQNKGTRTGSAPSSTPVLAPVAAGAGISAAAATPVLQAASAGALVAVPIVGVMGGVDLASGALVDVYPNPLLVTLIAQTRPRESSDLLRMFRTSRSTKARTERDSDSEN